MPDQTRGIRDAIEQEDFVRAGLLWEEWSAGPVSPAKWAEAQELYRWCRNTLLSERAHLLHQLNSLHVANTYLTQDRFKIAGTDPAPNA